MATPSPTCAALVNVTVENTDALHCVVCCCPLKPLIFLCDEGQFLCSSCLENELDEVTWSEDEECPGRITGGYRRCDAMEKLVESIRVPCPNAAYGCDATPAPYYDHHDHLKRCPHRPCHCPVESCGFAGSASSLLGYFTTVHQCPYTELTDSVSDVINLRDGCNVLGVVNGVSEKNLPGSLHLLVLTVSRERLGRAISVTCVDVGAYVCKLKLDFTRYKEADRFSPLYCSDRENLTLALAGLSHGLPESDDCAHFLVPRSFYPDKKECIRIVANVEYR